MTTTTASAFKRIAGGRRQGMNLVEVLVALGIIGLLMALLLPGVQSARSAARRVECSNHLHQIGVALHNCTTATGAFPEPDVMPQIQLAQWLKLADNAPLRCPADAFSEAPRNVPSYMFNAGTQFRLNRPPMNDFMELFRSRRPGEFTDGTSQTAAYSERRLAMLTPCSLTLMCTRTAISGERGGTCRASSGEKVYS